MVVHLRDHRSSSVVDGLPVETIAHMNPEDKA